MTTAHGGYYVPHHASPWPLTGSVGLFVMLGGFAYFLHGGSMIFMLIGAALVIAALHNLHAFLWC